MVYGLLLRRLQVSQTRYMACSFGVQVSLPVLRNVIQTSKVLPTSIWGGADQPSDSAPFGVGDIVGKGLEVADGVGEGDGVGDGEDVGEELGVGEDDGVGEALGVGEAVGVGAIPMVAYFNTLFVASK